MKSLQDGYGYNERLFSGGLRGRLHIARFNWLAREIADRKCPSNSVLELGCFDGKAIAYLPAKPARYVGYDANWENGLDIARVQWKGERNFSFIEATKPEQMNLTDGDRFDIGISMETLEHVPPDMVDAYLQKIAQHLNGYFFVTVPNERGVLFLGKWLIKKLFSKDADDYTFRELVNATLGRMHSVERDEHKGFDYEALIRHLAQYFDIASVTGLPFRFMPRFLSFGIAIVALSKAERTNLTST